MKKIINGKCYNTETAEFLGEMHNGAGRSDFRFCLEELYRTKKGSFFLYGEGGSMTEYATYYADGTRGWGEKIEPMTPERAREWAEEFLSADEYEDIFGPVEEA